MNKLNYIQLNLINGQKQNSHKGISWWIWKKYL